MIKWDEFNESFFELPENTLHIWRLKFLDSLTQEQFDLGLSLLDANSQKSALRFKFRHLQEKHIQTQVTLRKLLSGYLELNPADKKIEFIKAKHGKPYLEINPKKIMFNLSHSHDYALFAFIKNKEIGIDIEKIADRPYMELADRFFSKDEFELLSNLQNPDQQKVGFFKIWTRKEAYLKATGEGLSHPLNDFSVNISDNAKFLDEKLNKKWAIGNIDLGDFYCGSWVSELNLKKYIENSNKIYYIAAKNML